jgi:NADH-quinone oxidoreductase subunit H
MPQWLTPQLLTSLIVILVVFHLIALGALYLVLLERRVCAWVQDRCGPNRVGPAGLLQPVADAIKLLLKEDYIPRRADRTLFILSPAMAVIPALISFAVIPWGGMLRVGGKEVAVAAATPHIGIVYLVAVASLGVYGVVLGGWASNNKYSFLGGLRASAQMVSYEIPLGLCILTVILTAGTVRPDELIAGQLRGQWYLVHQPVAAILFYACMLAEANRLPFDLPEAESELVGGWHTEYSSMKWVFFFLAEYAHLIVGGAFFTVLFLGGWSVNPFTAADLPAGGGPAVIAAQVGIVLAKIFALVLLTMVLRWTLPRFRYDQLMRLAWEAMIPLGLLVLLVTSVFAYLGLLDRGWMWAGSAGVIAAVWLIQPLLRRRGINRRVGLAGSRFSPPAGESEASGPGYS